MNAPAIAETLPGLVNRALAALAGARCSADVLEARDLAAAAYDAAKSAGRLLRAREAHDALVAAAWRAQGDALAIEARAKLRLADEYDLAQQRGEVAGAGRPKTVPDENGFPATAAELGVSRRLIHEGRAIRDAERAEPGVVERTIAARLDAGLEPTKAALREIVVACGESEIRAAYKAMQAETAERKRARRAERELALGERIRAAEATLGARRYGLIYADPPWRFEPYSRDSGMDRAADNHYPTMSLDQILALEPPAADDCALFLWATAPMLTEALQVVVAWGFSYKTHIVWEKDRIITGYWARSKHELLLIATKGEIPAPSPGTQPDSVIDAPLGDHSEKPEVFAEILERLFPSLPKVELFARRARPGWDLWGAEAPEDAERATP
jgi:N6-adenosine-specific RNA methylase IME4